MSKICSDKSRYIYIIVGEDSQQNKYVLYIHKYKMKYIYTVCCINLTSRSHPKLISFKIIHFIYFLFHKQIFVCIKFFFIKLVCPLKAFVDTSAKISGQKFFTCFLMWWKKFSGKYFSRNHIHTAGFMKTVPSVYTLSRNTIYLSLNTKVDERTVFKTLTIYENNVR